MRDINRIDVFTDLFNRVWHIFSDMRFFQFVSFVCDCGCRYGIYEVGRDLFFVEESVTIEVLQKMLEEFEK